MNTPSPSPNPSSTTPGIGSFDGTNQNGASASSSSETEKDAVELLKADHREVEQLFSQFKTAKGRQKRRQMVEQIAIALIVHTMLEEEIFYPACREKDVEEDELDEAQVEHDTVKLLVGDLLEGSVEDEYYDAKVTVLSEYVKHHVGEEEQPSEGIFARAKSAGLDMEQLGEKIQARKKELKSDERRLRSNPPKPVSLNVGRNHESGNMAGYRTDHYRDAESQHGGNRNAGDRSGYDRNSERGSRNYDGYRSSTPGSRESLIGNSGRDDDRGSYRSGPGGYGAYPDMQDRDGHRRGIEQSGSGGRYRTYYGNEGNQSQGYQDGGHDEAQRSASSRGYRFRDENDDESHDDFGRGGRYATEQEYRSDRENDSGSRYSQQGGDNRGGNGNTDRNGNGRSGNNRGYPYGSR